MSRKITYHILKIKKFFSDLPVRFGNLYGLAIKNFRLSLGCILMVISLLSAIHTFNTKKNENSKVSETAIEFKINGKLYSLSWEGIELIKAGLEFAGECLAFVVFGGLILITRKRIVGFKFSDLVFNPTAGGFLLNPPNKFLTFRFATIKDLPDLCDLYERSYPWLSPQYSNRNGKRKFFRGLLKRNRKSIALLCQGNLPIAFTVVTPVCGLVYGRTPNTISIKNFNTNDVVKYGSSLSEDKAVGLIIHSICAGKAESRSVLETLSWHLRSFFNYPVLEEGGIIPVKIVTSDKGVRKFFKKYQTNDKDEVSKEGEKIIEFNIVNEAPKPANHTGEIVGATLDKAAEGAQWVFNSIREAITGKANKHEIVAKDNNRHQAVSPDFKNQSVIYRLKREKRKATKPDVPVVAVKKKQLITKNESIPVQKRITVADIIKWGMAACIVVSTLINTSKPN